MGQNPDRSYLKWGSRELTLGAGPLRFSRPITVCHSLSCSLAETKRMGQTPDCSCPHGDSGSSRIKHACSNQDTGAVHHPLYRLADGVEKVGTEFFCGHPL